MSREQQFDRATEMFTGRMRNVANWKHHYLGAAYTTRLEQAIKEARDACDVMEKAIEADSGPRYHQ